MVALSNIDGKSYPKRIVLFKVLEEIVVQNPRDALQKVGAEGVLAENLENMVGRARNLPRQPRRSTPLLLQFLLDTVADGYLLVFHKKSVNRSLMYLSNSVGRPKPCR